MSYLSDSSPCSLNRVVVTAVGVVSPLGRGWEATGRALCAAQDCVTPVEAFDVSGCRSRTAGQVQDRWLTNGPSETRRSRRLHRASRMMITAGRELHEADPEFRPEALVVGTTSGGMSFGEAFYRSLTPGCRVPENMKLPSGRLPRASMLANYSPQKPVLDLQEDLGWEAPAQIIANACASGTNAIGHAFNLVRSGQRSRVVCGGYDAISQLVFVGFDCLQASTPDRCRPFDKGRTGLVLGEGAALLALESLESARARGATPLVEITGYGLSTDNYHLTQPHPSGEGPYLAMRRALESARREASEIDYINAHGTATPFNDATEGAAIARLFPPETPVSSTKSMMGHSLGAAGAIEAVFCVLALAQGFLPPNINFESCDPQWNLNIVANAAREAQVTRAVSNSFGFGGTNASIVLEQI